MANHVWLGGMAYVDREDAATVALERFAANLPPLECERCGCHFAPLLGYDPSEDDECGETAAPSYW